MSIDGQRPVPEARRLVWGAVVVLTFLFLCPAKLWRPDTVFTIQNNIQIAEAQAWWGGRLDLPERKWDSALFNGRVYSHFPPMFSFLSAAIVPWSDGFPHWAVLLLIVGPTPLLAFWLFLRRTASPAWSAVLAIGLVCGTSALPLLDKTLRGANPYSVNQILALNGVLVFLIEYFGRRRIGVQVGGLLVAVWSRQLTAVFLVPLLWSAWRESEAGPALRRRAAALAGAAILAAVPLTLNALKFGNPLDSGYMHIYEDRPEDGFSRDARAFGIFSPHYVARNFYYANVGFPELHRITMAGEEQSYLRPNSMGTGIWWTTPLLLWVLVDIRRIWRERRERVLLLSAGLANLALLFYHSTGFEQRGFNRYSLDYVPALLALAAGACVVGRRRWMSAAMVVWSVLYFGYLIHWPHLRVG